MDWDTLYCPNRGCSCYGCSCYGRPSKEHNLSSANLLLERVAKVTDDRIAFFTSDQLAEYRTARLAYLTLRQRNRRLTRKTSG